MISDGRCFRGEGRLGVGAGLITIQIPELVHQKTHIFVVRSGDCEILSHTTIDHLPAETHSRCSSSSPTRLVSAQAAFLPVPREGQATFRPVIFNYQSYRKHPAVLVILVTRQGTSMTVVDNSRDTLGNGSWGQRLLFNAGGQRAPLTAERLSDVREHGVTANGEAASTLKEDANLLLLIQVPLKVRMARRHGNDLDALIDGAISSPPKASAKKAEKKASGGGGGGARDVSDVESAVLGHGPLEGPFTELAGLTVERDARFPIRVTAQFYQATSNGVVNRGDVRLLARLINRVYRQADYVGSLVLPDGVPRPTQWDGLRRAPEGLSWTDFPGLVERYQRYGLVGILFPPTVLRRLPLN